MKNQLFEDLIESVKELPTEILGEMKVNMNEEQLHEEFEKIASKHQRLSKIRMMRNKNDPSKYFYDEVQSAYDMFKASRESLVVELPFEISRFTVDENGWINPEAKAYDDALADVKEALEFQGIRYK